MASALTITAARPSIPASLSPEFMDLKSVLAPVAGDMDRVDALIRARLSSEVALINEIGGYIVGAGGKRLRPALVLLSAGALGGSGELACLLACVIEFIHTATLLHDDVVDRSDRRRGQSTANAVWGNSGAVLSGDFLYSRSFQLMVEANRMPVMQVMADTTNAIAEGEVLQLMNCNDPDVTETRYLRVIELKTARLFEAAMVVGAIAADANDQQQAAMRSFGHSLGMAYQLSDDLLDYLADPAQSGKNIGGDLAEGKPTLPLIHALRNGNSKQAALIRNAITEGRLDHLQEVLSAVEATDAIPYTRALAERHRDSALAALACFPESSHKKALQNLACFAVERAS